MATKKTPETAVTTVEAEPSELEPLKADFVEKSNYPDYAAHGNKNVCFVCGDKVRSNEAGKFFCVQVPVPEDCPCD